MTEYFADTYYYLAILNPADMAHARAKTLGARLSGRILTTAWVAQEVADGLCLASTRSSAIQFLCYLDNDPLTTLIEPDRALWREGIELYRARPDKDWSLTDCISFVVMQRRGLKEALTADHHFEQAGFVALMKTIAK